MKTAPMADKDKVPGPGAYDQSSKIINAGAPSYGMGTSKRDDLSKSGLAPGPGAYSLKPSVQEGPRFGFGTSKRDEGEGFSKTVPGPGAYSLKGEFEKSGHGTTLVPRRPDSAYLAVGQIPGPGAYNPQFNTKLNQPAYRIGSASRDGIGNSKSGAPGPGQYDPKTIKSNGTIRFGSSLRKPLADATFTPGPGAYSVPNKANEGPKYHMGIRKEDSSLNYAKTIPGPGAYNPSMGYVKDKQPSFGIGSGKRDDLYKSGQAPGPGQYDTRGRNGGPKWGFGSSKRDDLKKSDAPGPGAYNPPSKFADVPKYAYGTSPLKIHM
jgi:hypothetical protein